MSSERDKMMGIESYLDLLTREKPYRKIEQWDRSNARAELAALRATVAEQARQLEQAWQLFDRFLISSRDDAEGDCKYCECEIGTDRANDCYDDCIMNDVRAWLAMNPAPKDEAR